MVVSAVPLVGSQGELSKVQEPVFHSQATVIWLVALTFLFGLLVIHKLIRKVRGHSQNAPNQDDPCASEISSVVLPVDAVESVETGVGGDQGIMAQAIASKNKDESSSAQACSADISINNECIHL